MIFNELIDIVTDFIVLLVKIIGAYIEFAISLVINKPKKSIRNQVVVITGSGHGLGREMAMICAKLGAKLALIDINKDNNDHVVDEIRETGGQALGYCCDITSEESIAETAKQIQWDLGDVDILINNAGIVQCLPFESLISKNIKRTFEVNTLSHFWTVGHYLPKMMARGSGHIVAIASIAGLIGTSHLVDYCASKFAIVGLMESLEMELRQNRAYDNIKLTTVCPLAMTTGMFKKPKSRFNWIFPVTDAHNAAKDIIGAIVRNETMITVPNRALAFYSLGKIVPVKARHALQEFLGYGVDPHN
ncbi:epidermal retinol dehydrogenase 2-like [Oppia nitens]|uniref:epidermal retinol dehydrogenase 2-like n=1 Tax=Oppia nitens TaxID=1686743 RepID=UPI0023DAFC7A|nr:epidermal retinol dehydrogenase 2-like [Oppia nitens]